jgi:hypothetical protein
MKLKILIVVVLVLVGVVAAQELVDLDKFRACTPQQAQAALRLMSRWDILENTDALIEGMQNREIDFVTGLYNFHVTRQNYFAEVRPDLPDCANVHLFDGAYSNWLTNTTANMSLIALSQADSQYEDWPVMVENMQDASGLMYVEYTIMRSQLEAAADLEE